ncbi:MAG: hypothetical protein IT331_03445 [Anaerolineae bacterium]|nr:hypothetical protein [Anaerolineae bacterium]
MAKAKKAPQKKTQPASNRGLKVASGIFVAIGLLVVLSMIVSSVFTTNRTTVATPFPTAVFTPVPAATP